MKKVLKRVLVILLCVSVFCFPMTFSYASSGSLLPANVVTWDDVSADGKALAEAYINLIQSGSNWQIKEMFKSITDIPLSYFKLLQDGAWVLNPVEDIYYYFKDGVFSVHEEGHSFGGTRPGEDRPATPSDVYIPSDGLADFIDDQNTQYTPKNVIGKMSYRTDERFHSNISDEKFKYGYNALDLFNDGKFLANGDEQDIYLMFFASMPDNSYYGKFQFHFMLRQNEIEHWYQDRDEFMCYGSTLSVEYWDMINGSQDTAVSLVIFDDFIPTALILDFYYHSIVRFDDITTFYPYYSYIKNGRNGDNSFRKDDIAAASWDLYDCSSSLNTSVNASVFAGHYHEDIDTHDSKCDYGGGCDFGYIASTTPISTTYNVDTSKIPPNQIINITGDTIYDYSITNPDTGESTTINNYITNNYTYPVVDTPSDPSGGTGGDVTLGGNITVGGQVDVNIGVSVPDININVNQGSGAGGSGSGINPDDILDGSSVDLDKYYDDAVSQASGVRNFLAEFFSFLPAELVGLICMLVAVAIVCRIFGR